MDLAYPTYDLNILGFNNYDIDLLNQVLLKLDLKLEKDNNKLFDFGLFINYLCSNKTLRNNFIKNYQELNNDLEKYLLDHISLKLDNFKDQYYLFLLSLISSNSLIPFFTNMTLSNAKYYNILDLYFNMKMKHYDDLNSCYNILTKVSEIERTGWLNAKIPSLHKESIAEHMYNMHLFADLYLDNNGDYDKDKIKKLIMIHDLGEVVIGDIANPKKTKEDERKEDFEARTLFFAVRYYSDNAELYNLWDEWERYESIESKIAHDIDVIQFNYQFMTYACTYPSTFSNNDVALWMKRRPKSEYGIKLFDEIIRNNIKFKERIKEIDGK